MIKLLQIFSYVISLQKIVLKRVLFIILLFIYTSLIAQHATVFQYSQSSCPLKIVCSDSNYITAGIDNNSHSINVIKWDSKFNIIWTLKIPDTNNLTFAGIIAEPGGDIYLHTTLWNSSQPPSLVIKISKTGNVLWSKHYEISAGHNMFNGVISNSSAGSKGFVLSGGSCGPNGTVSRMNENGIVQWSKQYKLKPTNNPQIMDPIAIIPEDYGYTIMSRQDYAENNIGMSNFIFYKIDHIGNIMSQVKINSASTVTMNIYLNKMVKLNNGNGYAYTYNKRTAVSDPISQYVVFLDSSLNYVSDICLTEPYATNMFILSLVSTVNGDGVYVVGHLNQGFIMKLKKNATISWNYFANSFNNQYVTETTPYFNDIVYNNNDSMIVAAKSGSNKGFFTVFDTVGNGICNPYEYEFTETHPGFTLVDTSIYNINKFVFDIDTTIITSDYVSIVIDKYCNAHNLIENNQHNPPLISIYPIPTSDYLHIEKSSNKDINSEVYLYSSNGQSLYRGNFYSSLEIPTMNLNNGLYFLKIISSNQVLIRKIIINH